MTVQELLRAARNRIATTGWSQRSMGPMEGPNCTIGAVYREVERALGGNVTAIRIRTVPAYKQASEAINIVLGLQTGLQSVAYWNDRPGRTKEEVLALFDAALRLCGGDIDEQLEREIERREAEEVIREAEEIVKEAPAREPALV